MSDATKANSARARLRAAWPVRKFRLAEAADESAPPATTPVERLAMMWPLALETWSLAGRALPGYARGDTPIRVLRTGDAKSAQRRP